MYPTTSPYYLSDIVENKFLDVMVNRYIPKYDSDVLFEITPVYNQRPDLLAYDTYGDSRLWWVFAARNPNVLLDPLFDFVTGVKIYIPRENVLADVLGIS